MSPAYHDLEYIFHRRHSVHQITLSAAYNTAFMLSSRDCTTMHTLPPRCKKNGRRRQPSRTLHDFKNPTTQHLELKSSNPASLEHCSHLEPCGVRFSNVELTPVASNSASLEHCSHLEPFSLLELNGVRFSNLELTTFAAPFVASSDIFASAPPAQS